MRLKQTTLAAVTGMFREQRVQNLLKRTPIQLFKDRTWIEHALGLQPMAGEGWMR